MKKKNPFLSLFKAQQHKYVRRVPTGNLKRKWSEHPTVAMSLEGAWSEFFVNETVAEKKRRAILELTPKQRGDIGVVRKALKAFSKFDDGFSKGRVSYPRRCAVDSRQALEMFSKGEGEGSRGGKIIGHTGSGKPVYASKVGNHPVWSGKAISAKTEKGHEHLAPKSVKHEGKTYVKASHNSDTGGVAYHEHDPARHVLDKKSGFSSSYHKERTDHQHAKGGLFVVHGSPQKAGGKLPERIEDESHGTLRVRSHNSDTGKTNYHLEDKNRGWHVPQSRSGRKWIDPQHKIPWGAKKSISQKPDLLKSDLSAREALRQFTGAE